MAAGISSRFAPLSFEKPKGLLTVRGEVLIERQIRQLQEAGIFDITVIVGYMKEKFFYLEEKFGVRIVINEDYYRYNNTSSLIRVIDKIDETFICSSDNYFTENVFLETPFEAYYSAEYSEGETNEYCLETSEDDTIIGVKIGGNDSWYMIGHVYFNHEFSTRFSKILKLEYEQSIECREQLWENLYMRYLDDLHLKIKRYPKNMIKEFDSLEDLRLFDAKYIENADSSILNNICDILECKQSDLKNIRVIEQGMTNSSFAFYCCKDNNQYIYRYPGIGTSAYINRKSENFSMKQAKDLGLDDTFICMDENSGWKLSYFLEGSHTLDYHNWDEVNDALKMLRFLHNANIKSDYDFGLWNKILGFIEKIGDIGRIDFDDFDDLHEKMKLLYEHTQADGIEKCLCHCDSFDTNFLIDYRGKMYLIDWEYSGNADPGTDIGTFICCSDYNTEEAREIICRYLQHEPSHVELRHYYAYTSLISYCWFLWAIFQTSNGNNVDEYLELWYNMSKKYYSIAIKLY